jgi:hypothetical protein
MPGVRRSACITAVMVLPAAIACEVRADDASATESASADSADAIAGRLRRMMWDIRFSPDVKLVKARSVVMHVVRYLGERTNTL